MTSTPTSIVSFGKGASVYSFPVEQEEFNTNFGNLVTRTQRIPGADGGFDEYGDDPAPSEVGNISFRFWLQAASRGEMAAARDAVMQMASWGKTRLVANFGDQGNRFCVARINNISMPHKPHMHTDLFQPVSISFQVSDPFWYSQGTESTNWGEFNWGQANWGSGGVGFNFSNGSPTNSVSVPGNVYTFPRILITPPTGYSASDIRLQRIVGGTVMDEIFYNGTLTANQELNINCRTLTVLKAGQNAYDSKFQYKTANFFRLYPGTNTLKCTMRNASDYIAVQLYYYGRFR